MAEVISSIILTSGTVVKIPTFPQVNYDGTDLGPVVKYTRSGGVVYDYYGALKVYQMLSYDDMLELINILSGGNATAFNIVTPTSATGHYVTFLAWDYYYDNGVGEYVLSIPYALTGGIPEIRLTDVGTSTTNYYNGTSVEGGTTYSYYDKVADMEANPTIGDTARNIRSGTVYSIDICTNKSSLLPPGRYLTAAQVAENIARFLELNPDADITVMGYDPEDNTDPYIIDDPSTFGGGGGSREDPDEIEKAVIPELPSLSAVDTGLITMYGATLAQLQSLGSYLWASWWDIDTNFKKLFSDPMNCLIGLSIIPVRPTMGGGQNVKFGNITTNVSLNKLSSQWAEVDCGTVSIKEYVGSFLDYSPYVNISIYLPYIGYRELSPDDVMNDTIHVVYHIDCLTGGCCAFIECGKKGLLYTFNGSCIANVPITAINYSGAIQNAVSAVGSLAMTGVGIATGAAPVAAMGVASGLNNAANTAVNSKPTVQRSGNMGGAAGLMSYQKPLLVITRPRMSVPDNLNKFAGLTTNVTMPLSSCVGFTQVELIHLDGVPCTDDERSELLSLLKQGVIF